MIQCRHPAQEAGMAHWYSDGLVIEKSRVRVPAGTMGEFSPGSASYADSYFGIRSTPVLPQ